MDKLVAIDRKCKQLLGSFDEMLSMMLSLFELKESSGGGVKFAAFVDNVGAPCHLACGVSCSDALTAAAHEESVTSVLTSMNTVVDDFESQLTRFEKQLRAPLCSESCGFNEAELQVAAAARMGSLRYAKNALVRTMLKARTLASSSGSTEELEELETQHAAAMRKRLLLRSEWDELVGL